MGLFGKSDEEKRVEAENAKMKIEGNMRKAGLLFNELSDNEVTQKLNSELYQILLEGGVRNLDITNPAVMISMSPQESRHLAHLKTLIAQNMALIFQNELILRSLQRLGTKN